MLSLSDGLSNLHQTLPNVDCVSKVMCEQAVEALINALPFSRDHFSHKYVIWYASQLQRRIQILLVQTRFCINPLQHLVLNIIPTVVELFMYSTVSLRFIKNIFEKFELLYAKSKYISSIFPRNRMKYVLCVCVTESIQHVFINVYLLTSILNIHDKVHNLSTFSCSSPA